MEVAVPIPSCRRKKSTSGEPEELINVSKQTSAAKVLLDSAQYSSLPSRNSRTERWAKRKYRLPSLVSSQMTKLLSRSLMISSSISSMEISKETVMTRRKSPESRTRLAHSIHSRAFVNTARSVSGALESILLYRSSYKSMRGRGVLEREVRMSFSNRIHRRLCSCN